MNRFLLMPKPKPEFKMVQPLPAFFAIPTSKRCSAGVPEVAAPDFGRGDLAKLLAPAKAEAFTACLAPQQA